MTAVEVMATIAPQTGVYLPPEHGLVHMSKKMYALCKLDMCHWRPLLEPLTVLQLYRMLHPAQELSVEACVNTS